MHRLEGRKKIFGGKRELSGRSLDMLSSGISPIKGEAMTIVCYFSLTKGVSSFV